MLLLKPDLNKRLKLLLSFSGAYLLAVCVMHLIPEVYAHIPGSKEVGLFILAGFLLQLFLEFFSDGIEHGHVHAHKKKGSRSFPVIIMISLCFHAFLEGFPIEGEIHNHHGIEGHSDNSLLYGILLHKLPVAIALVSLLLQSGISRAKTFFWLIFFASMAPLGTIIGHELGDLLTGTVEHFFDYALAIVVGMFLHISTTILFESTEGHAFNLLKFGTIIVGGLLAFLTL